MRQEEERFFQIIFEKNSHVLFRYICGQLNNDRETAKDVLNDVWEVLVVKFETVADLEGEEMTKWLFCVAKNKIKNQRRKHYYQNEVSYTQYQKENRNEGEAAATAEIEERMVMQNCIQNLNPMDQRIFWGRAYGFSYKELSGFCTGHGGEIQLTDALASLARERGMLAVKMGGIRFDAGDWVDYLTANIYFGLRDEKLRDGLKARLRELLD